MGLFGNKSNWSSIFAPVDGTVTAVSETPDQLFSGKVLGDGVCIQPDNGKIVSPVDGTVVSIPHSKHAVCIQSDDGLEVLVHIGIDTVELNGEGFTCRVKSGQHVKVGEPILDVDIALVQKKGYQTACPCIITNMPDVKHLKIATGKAAAGKTAVMTYKK